MATSYEPKFIKIFQSNDTDSLESQFNNWVGKVPVPEVISITQSESIDPDAPMISVTLTVLYLIGDDDEE